MLHDYTSPTAAATAFEVHTDYGCTGRNELGGSSYLDACRALCESNDECVSFEWWPDGHPVSKTLECYLSTSCTSEYKIRNGDGIDLYVKLATTTEPPPPLHGWPTFWYMPLYSFSDDAGTKITSVGNNTGQWTGTVHKGAVLGEGSSAGWKALSFDGNDQFVSIDGGTEIGGGALTICANVKYDSFGAARSFMNFGNGDKSDNILMYNYNGGSTLEFWIYRGSTPKYIYFDNVFAVGEWVHVCVSVDSSGTMRGFKNGVELECAKGTACDSDGVGRNGHVPKYIRRENSYVGRGTTRYFHGSISDLTIIDGHAVTTEEEATDIMNYKPITSTVQGAVDLPTLAGRYLRIGSMVSNSELNFEEIEAFGSSGELLRASTATLSSVYSTCTRSTCTFGAEICIDGNIDGTGCHSKNKNNSDWFRVDYGAAVAVSKIAITTRGSYTDRIAGATVTLSHDADGKQVVWAGILQGSQDVYTFTFELQPLPPNTAIVLVADVAGTTLANDAYWAKACTNIPSTAIGITVDMGAVRDFFKPTSGASYCEMLKASNKHQWSANGLTWTAPDFGDITGSQNGGSAALWPTQSGSDGDTRERLSFWGWETKSGGCCSASYDITKGAWGHAFTMSYIYEKMDRTMKLSTLLVQKTKTKSEDDGTGTFWTGTVHNGAQLGAGRLHGFPQALTFNGGDQYVSIDGGVTIGGGPLSICVWAKWKKFGNNAKVIDFGNGADNGAILLYNVHDTSTLAWGIRGRDTLRVGNILQLDVWTHICGTFDSSGTMSVFVNGMKKTSAGGGVPNRLLRADAFIGRSSHRDGVVFAGSISDLTIMDGHAITSDEEATEIMRSSGIIRTMALSELESDGTKTYSEPTVTGIWHGTVHNGAELGPGRMPGSKALTFNGEDQHVSVDGGVTVGGSAFTACAWAKWTEFKRYSRVVDLGNGINSDMIYFGNYLTTNTLMFYIRHAGPTGSGTNRMISIDNILKKGEWIHICASVDTSATMTIHVNGEMEKCTSGNACDVSSGTGDGWVPKRILRTNAYIGKSNWADSNSYFAGSISDFTLIDGKAVTAAEARAIMDATGTTTTATTSKTTTTTTRTATTTTGTTTSNTKSTTTRSTTTKSTTTRSTTTTTVTETSTTGTSTTVTSTTGTSTTTVTCNGEPDPGPCGQFIYSDCTKPIIGQGISDNCPVLCDSCIISTQTETSTTKTATTTTKTSTTRTSTDTTTTASSTTNTRTSFTWTSITYTKTTKTTTTGTTTTSKTTTTGSSTTKTTTTQTYTTKTATSKTATSTTDTGTTRTMTLSTTTHTSTTATSTTDTRTSTTVTTVTTRTSTTRSATESTTTKTTTTVTSTTVTKSTTTILTTGTESSTTMSSTTASSTTGTGALTTISSTEGECDDVLYTGFDDENGIVLTCEYLAENGFCVHELVTERCCNSCTSTISLTVTSTTKTSTSQKTASTPSATESTTTTTYTSTTVTATSTAVTLTSTTFTRTISTTTGTSTTISSTTSSATLTTQTTTSTTTASSTTHTGVPTRTATTTVPTATPTEHAPGDCRTKDSNCNDCDMYTGACLRCRNSNYLLNSVCSAESSCTAAGLFPVGKASGGRACVAEGGLCGMPGCKPTLTACVASRVGPGGEEVCEACSRETFLVNGECKYRLTCKGPQFHETGAKCTCRHRTEVGGDIEKNCHRCHTYGSEKEGSYAALGPAYKYTFVKCYGCSGGYFFHDGSCITKNACPSTMVAYEGRNGYKNFCEPPFSCDDGKKQSGPNKGQSCDCTEKSCAACDWGAGSKGYVCTRCKRKQYLLNGACVSSSVCMASGGVPLGFGSHGRLCQMA